MTAQQQAELKKLQMSKTLSKLASFAKTIPVDVNKPEEFKPALKTIVMTLIDALDDNRISVVNDEDLVMFYALLTLSMEQLFDGKFTDHIKVMPPNRFN